MVQIVFSGSMRPASVTRTPTVRSESTARQALRGGNARAAPAPGVLEAGDDAGRLAFNSDGVARPAILGGVRGNRLLAWCALHGAHSATRSRRSARRRASLAAGRAPENKRPDYSVSVSNPKGSHLLYITVSSGNPGEAKLIADAYSEVVQTYIEKQMELRKPQILERAQVPSSPVTPKLGSIVLKAAGIGALAAIAVLVFLFLLDNKIRTGEDVEKATGLATLGMLPKQSENAEYYETRHRGETDNRGRVAEIRQTLALDYAGDEVINAICSNIAFAGKKIKRIAITSQNADNGKTYLAIRIAHGMTKRGKAVLLIDGDLRKSALVNRYGITHTKEGLSHYLSGQAELDGVIYQTNIPNLYLLPVGKLVQSPLSLLTSEEFDRLMEDAGREFETRTPVIGCIINNVTMSKLDRKRYDYGYGYGYYYGNAEKKNRKRSGTRR